jgi:hypothetical protein
VTAVAVYIGYFGNSSEHIERREGLYAATHLGWYKEGNDIHDLGFIRLRNPFEKVTPIPFIKTPSTGIFHNIAIVGYPMDLPDWKEGGNYMFEGRGGMGINQKGSKPLLIYIIDTFSGELI